MEVEIIQGMSNADYHASGALSSSGLKVLARSPLHFWDAYLNPERQPDQPTEAMRFGTAVHTLILEPGQFKDRYARAFDPAEHPDALRTADEIRDAIKALGAKPGKTKAEMVEQLLVMQPDAQVLDVLQQAHAEANAGRELIKLDDWQALEAIHKGAGRQAATRAILSKGKAEVSIFWTDPATGVRCRCRPDWLRDDGAIVDLKTSRNASEEAFGRDLWNLKYHWSAAFYQMGVEAALGYKNSPFIFAVIENDRPFGAAFYEADQSLLQVGREEIQPLLRTYAECMDRYGVDKPWPGYPAFVRKIYAPAWAANRNDDE